MVLVLGAGHRCSCMVRYLEMVEKVDTYIAVAGLINVLFFPVAD